MQRAQTETTSPPHSLGRTEGGGEANTGMSQSTGKEGFKIKASKRSIKIKVQINNTGTTK